MNSRLSRQSFLGPHSDEQLANSRACLIGLGGGGSHIAQQLAHLGVGNFVLYDADHVEDTNLNRLVGGINDDVLKKTPKTEVAFRLIKAINPTANVVCVSKNWQEEAGWVRDSHVVFGCVDTYLQREQIERTCRRFLIPYIDIGMDVTKIENQHVIAGQVILSMPGEVCMRCVGFLTETLLAQEAAQYGAAGGRPQVIWPNGILASAAVGIFVQLITPWHEQHQPLVYLEYDGNAQTLAPSNRLQYLREKKCAHFSSPTDVGDPLWSTNALSHAVMPLDQ